MMRNKEFRHALFESFALERLFFKGDGVREKRLGRWKYVL